MCQQMSIKLANPLKASIRIKITENATLILCIAPSSESFYRI
jgi:hypothetical protein